MELRDGNAFDLEITLLSLDDQQFVQEWLQPVEPEKLAAVKIFGSQSQGKSIDVEALAEVDDLLSIHAFKHGWLALRESGEVMTLDDRFPGLTEVQHICVNTPWIHLTMRDGKVGGAKGGNYFPDSIFDAVQCAGGNSHSAALLRDGTVKVWGRLYDVEEPIDPPKPLSGIIQIASCQRRIAAVHEDGRVFSWVAGQSEVHEAMLGDGIVEIEGSIFDFLGRTRSGEVYTWSKVDVSKAKIPTLLKEEGLFQQIRCNGSTRAAQRKDGTWIAWGKNSSGIVDHINSLGPVSDLAFFSEPGDLDNGYVIWREP